MPISSLAELNVNGKIGDLLINSADYFAFIAPEFLRHEIQAKHEKLSLISNLTINQINEAEYHICRQITFISEEQISDYMWNEAFELVQSVDVKDVHYVAYAKQFNCKIWSGDKKLFKGLTAKGFEDIITTENLFRLRNSFLKQ